MKTYTGRRLPDSCEVTVNGQPLKPRLDLWNHSPTGFDWGYEGSGPAQLALALLADALNDTIALQLHQRFKREVVARLPRSAWKTWTIRELEIRRWYHQRRTAKKRKRR